MGSLFSGIGGIDLGLERAGMKVAWQVEIDPWCRRVLAKHWPDVERFSDVKEVGAHNLTRVDVLAGGFPCQDISIAGRGGGITGARSGLWSEFARLIRVLRPKYVFVENVPALRTRGLGTVLADLAESGYDAEWDGIPAAAVGAPHLRDRIWLVAARSELGWSLADSDNGGPLDALQAGRNATRHGGSDVAHSDGSGRGGGRPFRRPQRSGWWATEPAVGRVAHGIPQRVDRLRGLGNAVVPQIPELIGRWIVADAKAMAT